VSVLYSTENNSTDSFFFPHGPIAQWLEQGTHNALVAGSNPAGPSFSKNLNFLSGLINLLPMKKYLMEFIGTFFLVLTIGLTVINGGAGVIPPLAIGSILMVMIYAGGHISGAHYNPAVTITLWLVGKCERNKVPGYLAAQSLAALVAAFLVLQMKEKPPMEALLLTPAPFVPFVAEFIGTFAIAFVVLNVAIAKANAGNSYYGLAIGFTVVACAFALGSFSGGAFNPAVAIGIISMGLSASANLWIYLLANFAGGVSAALVFRFLSPSDCKC
jgi:aquaporin Z